jgi:hypothetical protein
MASATPYKGTALVAGCGDHHFQVCFDLFLLQGLTTQRGISLSHTTWVWKAGQSRIWVAYSLCGCRKIKGVSQVSRRLARALLFEITLRRQIRAAISLQVHAKPQP